MPGPAFLVGDRVSLRTFEAEDVAFVRDNVNDASMWKALGGQITPTNLEMETRYFEEAGRDDTTVKFVVTEGGTDVRVGMVELESIEWDRRRAEVAFWIVPDHRESGYGRDALSTLVGYAFDQLGLHKLVAEVFAFNDASMELLETVGFVREGRLRSEEYIDDQFVDVIRYGLLEGEQETD